MDPQVERVLAEARARGIDVRDKLGAGSYCEAWAVGDALVMRIPRALPIDRARPLARGYGPLVSELYSMTQPPALAPVDKPERARELFEASIDRMRGVDRGPLARFVDRLELAGTPVALHERAPGRALATLPFDDIRAVMPQIAGALGELHDTLGYHGDLKPAHVFVDGERVTFIDPLPADRDAFGSLGYAVPVFAAHPEDRDEGRLIGDAAALAAIAAEACGVDLGWADRIEWIDLDRRGIDGIRDQAATILADLAARVRAIDDPILRGWIDEVSRLVFEPAVLPLELHLDHRRARARLDELAAWPAERARYAAFRDGLVPIATRVHAKPTLLDFVLEGEARPPQQWDYAPTFNAHAHSLAIIEEARREVHALFVATFGVPLLRELPPVDHPAITFEEMRPLRTLLLDAVKLFDPAWYAPGRLDSFGGLSARIGAVASELARDNRIAVAARRYVNYVCDPRRSIG